MRSPSQVIYDWIIRTITKPRKRYQRTGYNDSAMLKKHIRKGDVLLVDGDQRVSQAIKTLTMSSWSHNAVYIGDELIRRDHPLRRQVEEKYGDEARFLIIEALVERGVTVSPLLKYLKFNIRLCRPFGLRETDLHLVLDDMIEKIGFCYDVKNVVDLARYLLPFHLIPARYREDALHFGSGRATETICSSMTAEAFQKVGFPITPELRRPKLRTTKDKVAASVLGRPSRRVRTGIFRARHPTLFVPRDFDLSPYFEIIKFNVLADGDFDYRRIRWLPAKEP